MPRLRVNEMYCRSCGTRGRLRKGTVDGDQYRCSDCERTWWVFLR